MALRRVLAATVAALVTLRVVIACSGSDAAPGDLGDDAAALPERNVEDPDSASGEDGGDVDGNVALPPSFCDGIVFYANLDSTYAPLVATTPGTPFGEAKLVPSGKFAGSVTLPLDGSAGDGSAVYWYTPPDGGVPWYQADKGTVSLWYRGPGFDDATGSPVYWRAIDSLPGQPVLPGGVVLTMIGSNFGVWDATQFAQTPLLVFPRTEVVPYLKPGDFNHFVSGWMRGDGGGPSAVLAVNGGKGVVYIDGGTDASYADASPNDAGDLLVPYRGYRSRRWDDDAGAPRAFRIGGTSTSAPEGEIDDVVVWNRILTFAEIEAVYSANAPIGDVCKLH